MDRNGMCPKMLRIQKTRGKGMHSAQWTFSKKEKQLPEASDLVGLSCRPYIQTWQRKEEEAKERKSIERV